MEYYDENLQQTWSEKDSFTEERYLQFSEYIKEGQTVLDIGCNTGIGGATLKLNNPSVKIYGVELIKERVEIIPTNIYEEIYNESIITTNCNSKTFDIILAGELIEHIPPKLFVDMLYNCKNLLNDDGLILFTTPNPNSWLVKLGRDSVFSDPSHVNIMSIKEFKNIVLSTNLNVIEIKGSGKASRYLGYSFPISLYGSYMSVLKK